MREKNENNNRCNFEISAGQFRKLKIRENTVTCTKTCKNELALRKSGGVNRTKSTLENYTCENPNTVIFTKNT